jgi:DNA-binding MarR family transcriptional regulator
MMSPQPDGYLIYLIKQVEIGLRRHFIDITSGHGISYAEYTSLTVLQALPGMSSAELARRSFVRPQTMAETVTSLIEAGLVRKERDPGHGRRILLFITPLGLERIEAVRPVVKELEDRLVADLLPERRQELVESLRAVRHALIELSREDRRASSPRAVPAGAAV